MIAFLESKLSEFKSCFSRTATYRWFVIVILGLLTRTDKLGVTSFIRSLSLKEKCYECILHFFKSSAYSLSDLKTCWYTLIGKSDHLFKIDGRILLLGDGTKVSKEGKHIPGVQKLYQESENSAKAPYIFGHMFGGLAAFLGNDTRHFAVPISMDIHHGLASCADWDESNAHRATSHVIRLIENAYEAAAVLGDAILCLDRYFLTSPALKRLNELNAEGNKVSIVTRAKNNCVAYKDPEPVTKKRRGRPRKKGDPVKLKTLFDSKKEKFKTAKVTMYGKEEEVSYLCLDLLWGVKLYQKLRFVLVDSHRGKAIFVSTDTDLSPVKIIECYSYRFSIEITFRELKQQVGAFAYHFWTKSLPKLNRYKKKDEADNLSLVKDEDDQKRVIATITATERFVLFSCIAMGLTQMIALDERFVEMLSKQRYLRTSSPNRVSEATVLEYLRKHLFRLLLLRPTSEIHQIILAVLREDYDADGDDYLDISA